MTRGKLFTLGLGCGVTLAVALLVCYAAVARRSPRQLLTAAPSAAEAALARRIPEYRIDRVPVREAITRFGDMAGLNVRIEWSAIEGARIARDGLDVPISFRFRDVTVESVLDALCDVPYGDGDLAWGVSGDTIVITTGDQRGRFTVVRLYDVRDLIALDRAYSLQALHGHSPASDSSTATTMSSSGGRTQGLFWDDSDYVPTDEELVETIATILTENIDPDTWRDNGGNGGSLRYLPGRLFIAQSPANHRKIAALLDELRRTGGPLPDESVRR